MTEVNNHKIALAIETTNYFSSFSFFSFYFFFVINFNENFFVEEYSLTVKNTYHFPRSFQ